MSFDSFPVFQILFTVAFLPSFDIDVKGAAPSASILNTCLIMPNFSVRGAVSMCPSCPATGWPDSDTCLEAQFLSLMSFGILPRLQNGDAAQNMHLRGHPLSCAARRNGLELRRGGPLDR